MLFILQLSHVNLHSLDPGKIALYAFGAAIGTAALGLILVGPMMLYTRWVERNIVRLA